MHLSTTDLLNLLSEKPGRYIKGRWAEYVVMEADGTDVTVVEDGNVFPIRPAESQVDQLFDASYLVRDGSKYRLNPHAS
jgi:hypothetical protein